MVYSSLLFIYGYLPVSLLVYCAAPKKHQPLILLLFSLIFCGMNGIDVLLFMVIYTLINYSAGILINRLGHDHRLSALPFAAALIFDIFAVFFFRANLFQPLREAVNIPELFFLPGISFFTLSAVGVLIDVYTGHIPAEKNIIRFSLYIMMFPKLLMGPVLRYPAFEKALDRRRVSLEEIGIGIALFVKGLAKKILAADSMYLLYSAVKSVDVREMPALTAWLGIAAYLLCLYFTLSGFSDMGNGISRCFGLRLPQSFNYPFSSTKLRFFGAKWHTQVIQWFRRYVTKPFSALSRNRIYKKLIFAAAWTLFGFWYTFSANGAVWGALIGMGILIENRFSKVKNPQITGAVYTFFTVLICSVFLSGDSITYSLRYLFAMIGGSNVLADSMTLYLIKSYIVLLLICMYASTDLFKNMMMRSGRTRLKAALGAAEPAVVLILLILCTALMSYYGSSDTLIIRL